MILEEDIPTILETINSGGAKPEGVEAILVNIKKRIYSVVYFEGLGLYMTDEGDPIKIATDEEVKYLKGEL